MRAGRIGGSKMTMVARLTGVVVAAGTMLGIVFASRAPTRPYSASAGVLRLAWSARPERVEDCQPQSEEALAKLPAHMRQATICQGTTAGYRLEVWRDGVMIADQIVRGGGLRHDRALYVSREMVMPAGDTRIAVRFLRIDDAVLPAASDVGADQTPRAESANPTAALNQLMDATRRQREAEERIREREEAVPESLVFERAIRFEPRQVVLVTYDAEHRELVAIGGGSR